LCALIFVFSKERSTVITVLEFFNLSKAQANTSKFIKRVYQLFLATYKQLLIAE